MKHNALAVPAHGFEDVCAAEVKEILDVTAKAGKGVVTFVVDDLKDLCSYIYRAQTPSRVMVVLETAKGKDAAETIAEKITPALLKDWLPKDATFVVRAQSDSEDIPRQEIEVTIGGHIFNALSNKVDLKSPDVTFLVVVEQGTCYFGVDFSGADLGRRDYRIFLGQEALKGHVAASLVRLSGYEPKQLFIDLFCRNGVIPIEAAFMVTKKSPHFFGKEKFPFRKLPIMKGTDWDKLFDAIDKNVNLEASANILAMDPQFNNISAAKKNAKIAGIVKTITFSRTDLEFLDAKFGKHVVNTLVSLPPQPSVNISPTKTDAMLKDIFYQAEFVMKKGGTCVLITRTGGDALKKYAAEFKFTLKSSRKVWQGESELDVLVFEK